MSETENGIKKIRGSEKRTTLNLSVTVEDKQFL